MLLGLLIHHNHVEQTFTRTDRVTEQLNVGIEGARPGSSIGIGGSAERETEIAQAEQTVTQHTHHVLLAFAHRDPQRNIHIEPYVLGLSGAIFQRTANCSGVANIGDMGPPLGRVLVRLQHSGGVHGQGGVILTFGHCSDLNITENIGVGGVDTTVPAFTRSVTDNAQTFGGAVAPFLAWGYLNRCTEIPSWTSRQALGSLYRRLVERFLPPASARVIARVHIERLLTAYAAGGMTTAPGGGTSVEQREQDAQLLDIAQRHAEAYRLEAEFNRLSAQTAGHADACPCETCNRCASVYMQWVNSQYADQ